MRLIQPPGGDGRGQLGGSFEVWARNRDLRDGSLKILLKTFRMDMVIKGVSINRDEKGPSIESKPGNQEMGGKQQRRPGRSRKTLPGQGGNQAAATVAVPLLG